MPGTPPSVTCSVHSDPDQYRCSCRPEGSVGQPGAIPVNVTWPGGASPAPGAGVGIVGSLNERVGAELLADPGGVAEWTARAPRTVRKRPQWRWRNRGRRTCPQPSQVEQREEGRFVVCGRHGRRSSA